MVFGSESSNSRLAKFWNWEFTLVNDQLQGKRNEEVGLCGQTLFSQWVLAKSCKPALILSVAQL
jgi:hypothetical protein